MQAPLGTLLLDPVSGGNVQDVEAQVRISGNLWVTVFVPFFGDVVLRFPQVMTYSVLSVSVPPQVYTFSTRWEKYVLSHGATRKNDTILFLQFVLDTSSWLNFSLLWALTTTAPLVRNLKWARLVLWFMQQYEGLCDDFPGVWLLGFLYSIKCAGQRNSNKRTNFLVLAEYVQTWGLRLFLY